MFNGGTRKRLLSSGPGERAGSPGPAKQVKLETVDSVREEPELSITQQQVNSQYQSALKQTRPGSNYLNTNGIKQFVKTPQRAAPGRA